MYENRFIAFVDLLGFGALVEKSATEDGLPEKILEALLSLQPDTIQEHAYAQPNEHLIPADERESVMEIVRIFNDNIRKQVTVAITYFSDSLVISAASEDVIGSQMILDMLAKLNIKLWTEHSLLIRGGLTFGKLIHVQNGPLFGPAMNRAYYLESKLAKNPRILIDEACISEYRKVATFRLFESYIQQDGAFYFASLGTAFRHIINDSSVALLGDEALAPFRKSLAETTRKIQKILASVTDESVKQKYDWLLNEIALRLPETR